MAPRSECGAISLLKSSNGVFIEDAVAKSDAKMVPKEKSVVDKNHNEVSMNLEESQEKTPHPCEEKKKRVMEINDRSRKIVHKIFNHLNTNLNVLVLGEGEAGKSSLINSMSMALTQKWTDRAKYCPGRKHIIDECVMHRNRSGGKVVFSDTRGFEEVYNDEKAVLILRYVLEGRIPAKCIPCVLLMEKELIKKRYHKIYESSRRIDCVIFVSALNEEPPTRLMGLLQKAVQASKHVFVNHVPMISVITKKDTLSTTEEDEKVSRLPEYNLSTDFSTRIVDNYRCELDSWSDESANPNSMMSSTERDSALLAIWRDIIQRTSACVGTDKRKRSFSSANSNRGFCKCLPFRFDYKRLKSASL